MKAIKTKLPGTKDFDYYILLSFFLGFLNKMMERRVERREMRLVARRSKKVRFSLTATSHTS